MCFDSSTRLYSSPPSSDTVIEYVNTLGYPNTLRNVSAMSVNALYKPWRAILSMINMCLTGKTAGYDRPRLPTFLTDRKNLATAARGKKKTVHLLILSVKFTKLIIHHLRTKHNIYPRTGSPLYYSHEESILNTLIFVRKDGREIFGMPIPDALLTDEIKGAPNYGDYQEHVAKYQQFLDAEHDKAEEGGTIKSSDATKVTKPKEAKDTKPAGDKAPKPTATQPPKPKPHLLNLKSGLRVPVEEPAHTDEEADLQRALELSLKEQEERTQGPARPVVLREPDSGKYQPLLETNLSFKGALPCTLTTDSLDSPSLDAELPLTDSEMESDEEVPMTNAEDQDEGQARPNPESSPQPRLGVCCRPNREHMDLEATDASSQQKPEQMDEEFTTTAYPNVQENLKLPTEIR
ncbi:retrovirus-related pol polyprotein from transposon TNT 1-94 [Tanacetum coccineum]